MSRFAKHIKFSVLFLVFLFNSNFLYSQCDQNGSNPGCNPDKSPQEQICECCWTQNPICPIDSGVYYLLAAGLGYGIITIRKQKKRKEVAVNGEL